MDLRIIEAAAFEKIKQNIKALLEKLNQLERSQKSKEWLDNQDVCVMLDVSLRTLQTYRDKRIIPYTRIRNKCYYKKEDIEQLINKSKVSR
ncbi:MAG: helix-turn-helix domain-containing protein [Candidatus Azobacteroides sp.]|nr:helix-turn-helix domain-containing protein [Candidatus Azobacteroides sp.]